MYTHMCIYLYTHTHTKDGITLYIRNTVNQLYFNKISAEVQFGMRTKFRGWMVVMAVQQCTCT